MCIVRRWGKESSDVHPTVLNGKFQRKPISGDGIEKAFMPFGVMAAATAQVRIESPAFHKLGQGGLVHQWAMVFSNMLQAGKSIDQPRRENHVTNPERRKQDFAKCADVNDTPVFIEILEAGQRRIAVAEF